MTPERLESVTEGTDIDEIETVLSDRDVAEQGLACPICLSFLCDPVALTCGHHFCRVCVLQSTRLSPDGRSCPLCRKLIEFTDLKAHPTDESLEKQVKALVSPAKYEERLASMQLELEELLEKDEQQLPIFYMSRGCAVGQEVKLHLFEPRYRILIRRAMEGNRMFLYASTQPQAGDEVVLVRVSRAAFCSDGKADIVGTGVQRLQLLQAWVEENTNGLYYGKCSPDNTSGSPQPQPVPFADLTASPIPEVPLAQGTVPVFYGGHGGTRVGQPVALHLFEPRYVKMVQLAMGLHGSKRFIYAPGTPTAGMRAVLVGITQSRVNNRAVDISGKGLKEVVLEDVWVEPGTNGLHLARYASQPHNSRHQNGTRPTAVATNISCKACLLM